MKTARFGWFVFTLVVWFPSPAQSQEKAAPRGRAKTEAKGAITIRNVTKSKVRYAIKPESSDAEPTPKVLGPGAVDRFPGKQAMEITFERDGKKVLYLLDAKHAYSFRLDPDKNLELYEGSHGRTDAPDLAPYVPTPMKVVEKMLRMARLTRQDVLIDLGCGDGRIVIAAAKRFGTRGTGVDIVPQRIKESNAGARKAGVEKLVAFRVADATRVDLSGATVVMLYLLPESNALLRPKMEKELPHGARIVSHNYPVPGWKEIVREVLEDETGKEHSLYLYSR